MTDIFQDYWEKMLKIVETHGWAVQTVLSDGVKPGYSYTVGLSKRGLPEMLIVGVDQKFAQTILNNAVAKLVMAKLPDGRVSWSPSLQICLWHRDLRVMR